MFSAVYGIKLGKLDRPIINELFHLWHLVMKRKGPAGCPHRTTADRRLDLQLGSLLLDYLPLLQKLPLFLQPGYHSAMNLRRREMRLHFEFFRILHSAVQQGHAPDCFGKRLVEVSVSREKSTMIKHIVGTSRRIGR